MTIIFRSFVVVLCLACAACRGDKSESLPADGAAHGGTLVISVSGDPDNLLPPLAATVQSKIVADLVYDHLAEIGESLNTVGDEGFTPRLARAWEWASDSLSIVFRLDSAAKWHDGRPVRSSDVRFTHRIYSDSSTGSPFATAVASIDSVTTPDSLTAVFWFASRSPLQFYDAVHAMAILPEHAFGGASGTTLATAPIARAPVGSGRFRFLRWNPAASIELVADTANYRGRPGLDRVILTIAPDFNAGLTRLLGGEADVLPQVPAANLAQVGSDTTLRVLLSPGLEYNFVQFNMRNPKNRPRPHALFADRELRRAITAALDRRSIVRNAFDSLANVALGPTVRAYPTTDTTLRQIPFSPDAARRTLDSLGWKDADGDGVRERGRRNLEFTLLVPGSSRTRSAMAVVIQEQLRQVGVKMNIEPLDFAAFIDRETRHDFDAVFGGWQVEPSPGGIRQTWGGGGVRAGTGTNYGSYENTVFDAHVDSALAAGTVDQRRAHFTAAYRIIIDDAPAVWLAEAKRVLALHRRLQTKALRPDAWWSGISDWTVPVEKRIARDRAAPAP